MQISLALNICPERRHYMEDKVTKEILSWLGTKWRHMQAVKGHGVDCIQFPIAVARNLGWLTDNFKPIKYSRDWAAHNFDSILLTEVIKVAKDLQIPKDEIIGNPKLLSGDIIMMAMERTVGHAGLYIGNNEFVHANIRRGVVRESLVVYKDKLHSVWRFQ